MMCVGTWKAEDAGSEQPARTLLYKEDEQNEDENLRQNCASHRLQKLVGDA